MSVIVCLTDQLAVAVFVVCGASAGGGEQTALIISCCAAALRVFLHAAARLSDGN